MPSQHLTHKPATIFQQEPTNKPKGPRRKNNRYNKDRREKNVNGNQDNVKESVLKSWWNKLID